MDLTYIKDEIPSELFNSLEKRGIKSFLPSQEKAINQGLLSDVNLLVCTPTASGKTLIAEIAAMKSIYEGIGKAIYVSPLKALSSEKYREFKERYPDLKISLSIGDFESTSNLDSADLILTTSEKLDSEIRHMPEWLKSVKVVIFDEVHLLNDPGRGPTLEIIITILKNHFKGIRLIALSATIGNQEEFADWLSAELIQDAWRPVELKKGIYLDGSVEFFN